MINLKVTQPIKALVDMNKNTSNSLQALQLKVDHIIEDTFKDIEKKQEEIIELVKKSKIDCLKYQTKNEVRNIFVNQLKISQIDRE